MMRQAVAFAVLIILCASAMADDVRVSDPRPFGYFLGDTLTRTIEISRRDGETLVAATLPPTGPAAYWLEIRNVDSTVRGERYVVSIEYQIFYAAIDTRMLRIPGFELSLQSGNTQRAVAVPPLNITISPLREIFPDKAAASQAQLLRHDAQAQPAPVRGVFMTAFGSVILAVTGLFLLAHHNAWWPFRRTPQRPFTRAAREISRLYNQQAKRDAYSGALTLLHRAFDERAGRRIFADDVGRFLKDNSEHRQSEKEIAAFFEASREVFFADNEASGVAALSPDHLGELAGDLALQERQAR